MSRAECGPPGREETAPATAAPAASGSWWSAPRSAAAPPSRRLTPTARLLLNLLGSPAVGRLYVRWVDGRVFSFRGTDDGPSRAIHIVDPAAPRRMLLGGSVGFAEGYMDGLWDTPDLLGLLDLLAANIQARAGRSRRRDPLQPVQRLIHLSRPNTRRGARRNIAYHYDLGNDFYRLWLDETMTYSCALFGDGDGGPSVSRLRSGDGLRSGDRPLPDGRDGILPDGAVVAQAQRAKWDRLLDLIDPSPGSRLLEIGCGWGGFAVHAARERGCHVTAITLSEPQLEVARERVQEAGVADRVELRLQDYRDVEERYDGVASIEMFEAVGERYWPAFFDKVRKVLDPGGRAGLQVITIDHARFQAYRGRADFIQKYIFPGGMLPSPESFRAAAMKAGLTVHEPDFFASDYAITLACWLDRFDQAVEQVEALGFDERFRRMWRYYLAYCAAGFRNRMIDVMQVALT